MSDRADPCRVASGPQIFHLVKPTMNSKSISFHSKQTQTGQVWTCNLAIMANARWVGPPSEPFIQGRYNWLTKTCM